MLTKFPTTFKTATVKITNDNLYARYNNGAGDKWKTHYIAFAVNNEDNPFFECVDNKMIWGTRLGQSISKGSLTYNTLNKFVIDGNPIVWDLIIYEYYYTTYCI